MESLEGVAWVDLETLDAFLMENAVQAHEIIVEVA